MRLIKHNYELSQYHMDHDKQTKIRNKGVLHQ